MDYRHNEKLDIEKIKELLESYTKATGLISALMDLDGNILTQSGWQDICTQFHRINPETALNCRNSDVLLATDLQGGNAYNKYTCLNGLVDIAVPIIVNGKHVYNLFTGQFLTEAPKEDFFIAQAKKYSFDKKEYIKALRQVPVLNESVVKDKLLFLSQMTEMIIDLSFAKHERVKMNKVLSESEEYFRSIINQAGDAMYLSDLEGNIKMVNNLSCEMLGYSMSEFLKLNVGDLDINYIDPKDRKRLWNKQDLEKPQILESTHKRKDGGLISVEIRFSLVIYENNKSVVGFVRDVTERKRAEEIILKNEARLHYALDSVEIGAWELDLVTFESWRTSKHDRIFGYNTPLGNWTFDMFLEHIIPEDRHFVNQKFQDALETKTDWNFECRIKRKNDNSMRWIWANGHQELDEKVEAIKMFGIVQDITERKLADEELKENEEKFRALYDNAPLSYQSLNEDGSFKDVNPTWLHTLGYERGEVIGKFYKDFLHPEWQDHFEENFPKFKKRGSISDVQFKIRHKKGHYIDISFEGCIGYHPDGSFKQTYCVFKDISEQKKAEHELNESLVREGLLADIVRESSVGIVIGYPDGELGICNSAYQKITGYSESDLKGAKWNMVETPPEWKEAEAVKIEELHKTGRPVKYEKEYIKKDGTRVPIEVVLNIQLNADKEIEYYYAFVTDITERKEAELELSNRDKYITTIMDHMPIGFGVNSIDDGEVKYLNKLFEDIYGWPKEILTNTSVFYEKVFPDSEYREKMKSQIIADMQSGDPERMHWNDLKIVTNTGEERFVTARNIPLIEQNQMISTVQDTTKRKLAEDEVLKHQEHLEDLVRKRTNILEEKNIELERFNELFVDREFRIKELKEQLKKFENLL